MFKIETVLKDGKRIETTPLHCSKLTGIEELLPTIEKLKETDGDYNFNVGNNTIKVKARDIVSVNFVFI